MLSKQYLYNLIILVYILEQSKNLDSFYSQKVILTDKYFIILSDWSWHKWLLCIKKLSEPFFFVFEEKINSFCILQSFFFFTFFFSFKSFTLRGDSRSPASAQKFSSRSTVPVPAKRRSSALWSETLDGSMKQSLTSREIRRQEVCAPQQNCVH